MICVEQYEKPKESNFIKKIKEKFSSIIIEENEIEKEKIIIVKVKKTKGAIKKFKKFLKNTIETNAILENKLEESIFEKILIENNIEIMDGKKLFVELLNETLFNYICRNQKRKISTLKISILTNEDILRNKKIIENLSKKVKELIIYTKRIEKFKNIENKLREKFGINITITNIPQILEKSEIYINLDLNKEEVEKINFNRNSIFINTFYKFSYNKKNFNGINIIDYEIKFPIENLKLKEKLYKYENKKIVEYFFYNNKKLKMKKIKINYLVGKNGKLMREEFYRKR